MAEREEREQDLDGEDSIEPTESVDVEGRDTLVSPEGEEAAPDGEPTAPQHPPGDSKPAHDPASPAESFGRGLGMLWQAARGAATGLRQEVQQSGARDAMRDAGRQLEGAASTALRGVEQLVRAVGRPVAGGSAGRPGTDEPVADDSSAEDTIDEVLSSDEARSSTPADSADPPTTPEPSGARIALDDEES